MDRTQVLTGIAEVAIAFAGFSGVVTAFRRSEEIWLPEDRFRLTVLILSSMATVGFSFLPLLLWEVAGTEPRVWRVSSACWSVFGIWLIVWSQSRIRRLRTEDPTLAERVSPALFYVMTYGLLPLLVAISLANAMWWGAFTPYLLVVLWGLLGSGIQFARILQSVRR